MMDASVKKDAILQIARYGKDRGIKDAKEKMDTARRAGDKELVRHWQFVVEAIPELWSENPEDDYANPWDE